MFAKRYDCCVVRVKSEILHTKIIETENISTDEIMEVYSI